MSDFETFDVVRCYDIELLKYNTTRECAQYGQHRDLGRLNIPPESHPVTFGCRVLSRSERREVKRLHSDYDRYELAFRYGIVDVRNLKGVPGVAPARRSGEQEPLSDEALDALKIGDTDIEEVGSVILAKSVLAHGTPLSCPLLDSSQRAFGAAVSLLAEQKKTSATDKDD